MKLRFCLSVLLLAANTAQADNQAAQTPSDKKGQWTFGVGVFGANLPHYYGAEQSQSLLLPFPYIRYQSEKLTIDRNGIKRKLWDSEHLELTFSGSGAIRVNSDDNRARAGMPNLGWVGAIGPALNWYVKDDKSLYMQLTARKAWAIDGGIESIGWQSELSVNWSSDKRPIANNHLWYTVLKARVKYDSADFNQYFYGVDDAYITATRAGFKADDGYAGAQLLGGLNFEGKGYRAGVFARYNHIGGATFEHSPLVKQKGNLSFGFAYAWLF